MRTDSTLLEASGLTVRFGGLTAVNSLALSVGPNEVVGLIGPNGAGKTTVLNALSRLVPSSADALGFREHDLLRHRADQLCDLGIARTFQTPQIIGHLTIAENVTLGGFKRAPYGFLAAALGTRACRDAERRLRELAMEKLALCGVSAWAEREASAVPYGVLKLTEIARALMSDPQLLLLDEPVAGTTQEERADIRRVLTEISSTLNCSVLVIDHDVDFIAGLCTRVNVMNFGRKIAEGTPDHVVSDPDVREAYLGAEDDD